MTTKIAPKTACNPSSPERQRAFAEKREQLAKNGITDAQRSAGHGMLSQRLYDQIVPEGYFENRSVVGTALNVLFNPIPREHPRGPREDTWAIYLGLPQKYGTVQLSEDVPPGTCPSPDHEFYKFADMDHSDTEFVNAMVRKQRGLNALAQEPSRIPSDAEKHALKTGRYLDDDFHFGFDDGEITRRGSMGTYTASFGRDERGEYVDYRDFWDLDPKVMGIEIPAERIAGHPFDIYGRVHFDRQRVERVIDLEDEVVARSIAEQVGGNTPEGVAQIKAAFRIQPTNTVLMEHRARLVEAFRTGLPEDLRPYAEELARLDPRYPTPVFKKDAPSPIKLNLPPGAGAKKA